MGARGADSETGILRGNERKREATHQRFNIDEAGLWHQGYGVCYVVGH